MSRWKDHWLSREPFRLLHEQFGLLDWEPWRGTWPLHIGWKMFRAVSDGLQREQEARASQFWYSGLAALRDAYSRASDAPEIGLRLCVPGGTVRLIPSLVD